MNAYIGKHEKGMFNSDVAREIRKKRSWYSVDKICTSVINQVPAFHIVYVLERECHSFVEECHSFVETRIRNARDEASVKSNMSRPSYSYVHLSNTYFNIRAKLLKT